MDAPAIGARLAERRRDLGITQDELATLLGLDRTYLSRIEAGQAPQFVQRLVAALDMVGLELDVVPRQHEQLP